VLRFKRVDETGDGTPDLEEEYDPSGRLVKSRESDVDSGRFSLTWHYNEQEEAVRAEKDTDGDGVPEIWFHYENGRITHVEEDRNGDGVPDLWEIYDQSGALVERREDLDFDGIADVVRKESTPEG
jgi:hypothetical protein